MQLIKNFYIYMLLYSFKISNIFNLSMKMSIITEYKLLEKLQQKKTVGILYQLN